MIILTQEQRKLLQFFRLKDFEEEEQTTLLKKPFFKLKFQHKVRDFYLLRENILNHFHYKSFIIIFTTQSSLIYWESKRNIIIKIFALPNPCNDSLLQSFSLLSEPEQYYDKTMHDIKGVFMSLWGTSVSVSVISNLFTKKQVLLEDVKTVDL